MSRTEVKKIALNFFESARRVGGFAPILDSVDGMAYLVKKSYEYETVAVKTLITEVAATGSSTPRGGAKRAARNERPALSGL